MTVLWARRRLQGSALAWLVLALGPMAVAPAPAGQIPLVNVGILTFQDESGTHAPPELLQKIGQDLRLKLTADHKDLLGRALPGGTSDAGLEQLTALGRQQGIQFVVRGALLSAASESTADELRCRLELYCDVIDVDSGSVSTFRSEGTGAEKPSSREDALRWDSYAWEDPGFGATAPGLALDAALGGLVENVHSATVSLPGGGKHAEEAAAASGGAGELEAPSVAESELTAKLKELLSGVLARFAGIQEVEAAMGAEGEAEYGEPLPADQVADEVYYVEEEAASDVSGVVVDEEGEPLEGITVVEPETGASAVTDASGSYFIPSIPGGRVVGLHVVQSGRTIAFTDLAAGSYVATVMKAGYKDGNASFTVKAGATVSVQIRLSTLSLTKK
jgi:hypothetical protein